MGFLFPGRPPPSKYIFDAMILCVFYPLIWLCQQCSYFKVISNFCCSTMGLKVGRKLRKTLQEVLKESQAVWVDRQQGSWEEKMRVHRMTVHWHAFSQHGCFTCPVSLWANWSTAVLVPWTFCPGSAGLQNHWGLDEETTRDLKLFSTFTEHL